MKSARRLPLAFVGLHTIALTVAILILPTVPRSESIALLAPQPAHGVDLSGPYRLPVAYSFVAERVFTLHKYPQPFRLLFLPDLAVLVVGHVLSLIVFLLLPGIAPWHLSWLHFVLLLAVGGAHWWLVGFITAHWLPSSRRLASGRRAQPRHAADSLRSPLMPDVRQSPLTLSSHFNMRGSAWSH